MRVIPQPVDASILPDTGIASVGIAPESTVSFAVAVVLGFGFGYLFATLSESLLHRSFGHSSSRVRSRSRKIPFLSSTLIKLHHGHTIVHHARTFRTDHVTQFSCSKEQEDLDQSLREHGFESYIGCRYGLVTNMKGVLYFILPPLTCCVLISWFCSETQRVPFLCAAIVPILFAPMLSCFVHPYLHQSAASCRENAPAITTFILSTSYGRWARISHFVHHRHPRYNFNLLPGGDLLLGCYRKPTDEELLEMVGIGLLDDDSQRSH